MDLQFRFIFLVCASGHQSAEVEADLLKDEPATVLCGVQSNQDGVQEVGHAGRMILFSCFAKLQQARVD